ncbi:isochorismatase family protein [Opitutaceae bacterium]
MAQPPPISGVLLLCLDLQAPFLDVMPDGSRVLKRCQFAAAAAHGLGIPVAFTEQVPQKLGPTVPALLSKAPGAPQYGKTTFSALADDGIRDAIRAFDVDHLILCGLETPVCIYQTALDALDQQFQVTLLSDAITARRADDAAVATDALVRAGIHVLPAETVFYALLRDARHPFFKTYTQLVKDHA